MTETESAWNGRLAPGLEEFELLGRRAFASLPEEFRALAGDITIAVAEFPEDDVVDELEAESPFEILGLFEGVGLAHAPATPETGSLPNRIWLYRRPILDYWAEHEEALGAIVANVLIHEIGHHFGLSDEDMDAIEAAAG
jgi:predicted Zn-dependent protease with MMP-like domain